MKAANPKDKLQFKFLFPALLLNHIIKHFYSFFILFCDFFLLVLKDVLGAAEGWRQGWSLHVQKTCWNDVAWCRGKNEESWGMDEMLPASASSLALAVPLSPWEVLESLFAVLTKSYDYCLWTSSMPVSQNLAKLRGGWSIKYKEWKGGKELESLGH